jgi:uncharacterized protein (DUF952 family)
MAMMGAAQTAIPERVIFMAAISFGVTATMAPHSAQNRDEMLFPHLVSDYSALMTNIIYKICPQAMWRKAEQDGVFPGAPVDIADGFIHFSTADQVKQTAALHFAGQSGLLLVAVDGSRFADKLVFEPSRGGDLFPHLYADLPLAAVLWEAPLPLDEAGAHIFPELQP